MRYLFGSMVLIMGILLISSAQVSAVDLVTDGHIFQMTMIKSDGQGRGDDYLNPAPINEQINVTIKLNYFGTTNESNVVVTLWPYLNGYSTFKMVDGGEFPAYDPHEELNQSKSMENLYDIAPSAERTIDNVEPGERTILNYTVVLKTAGSWNYLVTVTVENGTTYLLAGTTGYVSRNVPSYLDGLLFVVPTIVGLGSAGLTAVYIKKRRLKKS